MSPEQERFDPQRILDVLDHHRVDYVLVGGFGSQLHGARRQTFDLGVEGGRVDRYRADRMVKRLVKHGLRHSFITAALDAGVPLRDVQAAASHADPRTTMRYDRARRSLDRHATYIVSTFIAGATRPA